MSTKGWKLAALPMLSLTVACPEEGHIDCFVAGVRVLTPYSDCDVLDFPSDR